MINNTSFARRVARLHAAQQRGDMPPPGRISRAQLASALGTSETSLRRVEAVALAKLRAALSSRGISSIDIPDTTP
jgi:hypothetical protein